MTSFNETITMQNLRKYCEDHNYRIYEKKAGSSSGALFEVANKYMCNVRFMDLLPGDESDFVDFEVHCGVHTTV